jgi:hypothetical protein
VEKPYKTILPEHGYTRFRRKCRLTRNLRWEARVLVFRIADRRDRRIRPVILLQSAMARVRRPH